MNKLFFIGRLTKDPVIETSSGGNKYCNFTLAIDRVKNSQGEKETDFPKIVAFGKNAENMVKFTEKGNLLAVEGAFRTSKFEKEGKTFYRDNIVANRVEFLQWKKVSGEEPPAPASSEASDEIPKEFVKIENAQGGSEEDIPF